MVFCDRNYLVLIMAQLPETPQDGNKTLSDNKWYQGCKESMDILNGNDDNVVCMIRRKRASNLIVYRAKIHLNGGGGGGGSGVDNIIQFDSKQPIEIFWLKLSKQDLKKHRECGKLDDRVELSKIERKLAYGITCKKINGNKKNVKRSIWSRRRSSNIDIDSKSDNNETLSSSLSYKVTFNALKSMTMTLRINPINKKPNLCGMIMIDGNDIECIMKEIWVTMRKSTKLGIPKVDYLTIKAIRCDNNESIEYILKK